MSDAPDDASRWSWATPDGKTVTGAKGELMLALRSERLPAGTLVWRPGWAEWIPASRVTELKSALPPGKAEPAQAQKLPPPAATSKAPATATPQPARAAPVNSQPPPAPVRGHGGRSPAPPAPVHAKTGLTQPPPAPVRGHHELPRPSLSNVRVPSAAGPVPAAPGAGVRPRGESILGPPREQMQRDPMRSSRPPRAPLNTLGYEEAPPNQATLRPPGAVPPPPRGGVGGGAPFVAPSRVEDELPTQRHQPISSAAATQATHAGADAPPPTELRSAVVLPTTSAALPKSTESGPTARGAAPDFDATLGSTPFEQARPGQIPPPSTTLESAGPPPSSLPEPMTASVTGSSPATVTAPPSSTIATTRPSLADGFKMPVAKPVAIFFGIFIAGILLLAVGASVLSPSRESTGATDASASPAERPLAPPGCTLVAPAARLATTVERSVQPAFAELAPKERVAVGFASVPKTANGLLVRLDTLDAEKAFEETSEAAVRGSAPRVAGGKARFSVDRAGGELSGARTLADGSVLGFAAADLVRLQGGAKAVLFPGAGAEKLTEPRTATSAKGTLVTFRRGGLAGQVLYGWLSPDGTPNGKLVAVNAPGIKFSGTPDAAANREAGLVAFAGRPSESADWRVQLAVAGGESVPAKVFEPPPGGSGGGNIAPTVSALGDDGWLLQWTEGAAGAYQVRLQRLGTKLEPLGEARLVSPKGANAGQGAVFATGSRVLSVFIQTTAGHDELWGATFECR
jgi:hypothetical protein